MSSFSIGEGLFASKDIPPNTVIIFFDGVRRNLEEYTDLFNKEKGGYAHHLDNKHVYDCFNRAKNGLCMASMANSALNLTHCETGKKAKNNAKKI